MKGDYPQFKDIYSDEELAEHFFLSSSERLFVAECRSDANRLVVAVLLKSVMYLGYFPEVEDVPPKVLGYIAKQLDVFKNAADKYSWSRSTKSYHLSIIRAETGYRSPTAKDKEDLESWLREDACQKVQTQNELFDLALGRLAALRIELPAESELERIVAAALHGYHEKIYQLLYKKISQDVQKNLDQMLDDRRRCRTINV